MRIKNRFELLQAGFGTFQTCRLVAFEWHELLHSCIYFLLVCFHTGHCEAELPLLFLQLFTLLYFLRMFSSSWHLSAQRSQRSFHVNTCFIFNPANYQQICSNEWTVTRAKNRSFEGWEECLSGWGRQPPLQYFRWVPAPTSNYNEEGCDPVTRYWSAETREACPEGCVSCFWASCCEHLQLLSGSFRLEAAVESSRSRRGCNVIMIQRNQRQVLT